MSLKAENLSLKTKPLSRQVGTFWGYKALDKCDIYFRRTTEKPPENSDKLNKLDCYEAMFALNHLTLLLYERVIPVSSSPGEEVSGMSGSVEPDLVSVAECSVEQGVVSACSLPSGDEVRASLFTATLAISTNHQGMCRFWSLARF